MLELLTSLASSSLIKLTIKLSILQNRHNVKKSPIDKVCTYMYNKPREFEWDENKDQINRKKHGVSFEKAKQVFDDPRAIPFEDLEHSHTEVRYKVIGLSQVGLLLVSFTYRKQRVRIISARRANAHLQRMYEDEDYEY